MYKAKTQTPKKTSQKGCVKRGRCGTRRGFRNKLGGKFVRMFVLMGECVTQTKLRSPLRRDVNELASFQIPDNNGSFS
jgi:hypothetical protein